MIKYHKLSDKVGYWKITDVDSLLDFDAYKSKVKKSSFGRKNSINPFYNQPISHIDETHIMLKFLEDFYHKNIDKNLPQHSGYDAWTNLYDKKSFKCNESGLIPHIDSVNFRHGIVANLWLNKDIEGSGTNLYHYNGKVIEYMGRYKFDFMVDSSHPLFEKYHFLDNNKKKSYTNKDWTDWGFECVGIAPSEYKTITMYKINTPHTAFIPENVEKRYSASFLYEAFCPILLS